MPTPPPHLLVLLSLCTAVYLGGDRLDNHKGVPILPPTPGADMILPMGAGWGLQSLVYHTALWTLILDSE